MFIGGDIKKQPFAGQFCRLKENTSQDHITSSIFVDQFWACKMRMQGVEWFTMILCLQRFFFIFWNMEFWYKYRIFKSLLNLKIQKQNWRLKSSMWFLHTFRNLFLKKGQKNAKYVFWQLYVNVSSIRECDSEKEVCPGDSNPEIRKLALVSHFISSL